MHFILDDFDLKNLERKTGNNGEFSKEAKRSGTLATKHFDNINDYRLHKWFHSCEYEISDD